MKIDKEITLKMKHIFPGGKTFHLGNSLAVTIPDDLVKIMNLDTGRHYLFANSDKGNIVLVPFDNLFSSDKVNDALGLFGNERLGKEDLELLLRELVKEEKD